MPPLDDVRPAIQREWTNAKAAEPVAAGLAPARAFVAFAIGTVPRFWLATRIADIELAA